MKYIKYILLTTCLILVTGCSDEDTFTRYPSVSIPEYKTKDYPRELSDPESELVYNAVCNLAAERVNSEKRCARTMRIPIPGNIKSQTKPTVRS